MADLFREAKSYMLKKIAAQLRNGEHRLPIERELAKEVPASYGTIRLVMSELEKEGFVRKIRRAGTFITENASCLLERNDWKTVGFFHPPSMVEEDFNAYFGRIFQETSANRRWNCKSFQVENHEAFFRLFRQNKADCDAVVYLPPVEPLSMETIGKFSSIPVPFVLLDTEVGNISLCNLVSDNRRGGMLAANEFIHAGFRNLLLVICEPRSRQASSRITGFQECAEMAGVSPVVLDCQVAADDDRVRKTEDCLLNYWRTHALPEAVFAISDAGALGVLNALEKKGIQAGREVSVVGFDGLPAGYDGLSSVAQPVLEMSAAVFDFLEDWSPKNFHMTQFAPKMIARKSFQPNPWKEKEG